MTLSADVIRIVHQILSVLRSNVVHSMSVGVIQTARTGNSATQVYAHASRCQTALLMRTAQTMSGATKGYVSQLSVEKIQTVMGVGHASPVGVYLHSSAMMIAIAPYHN